MTSSSHANLTNITGTSRKPIQSSTSPSKTVVAVATTESRGDENNLPSVQERIEQFQQILKQQKQLINNNGGSVPATSQASPQFSSSVNKGQIMFNRLASSNNSLNEFGGNEQRKAVTMAVASSNDQMRVIKLFGANNSNNNNNTNNNNANNQIQSESDENKSSGANPTTSMRQAHQQQQSLPSYLYQNGNGMQLSPQNVNKFVRQQSVNNESYNGTPNNSSYSTRGNLSRIKKIFS